MLSTWIEKKDASFDLSLWSTCNKSLMLQRGPKKSTLILQKKVAFQNSNSSFFYLGLSNSKTFTLPLLKKRYRTCRSCILYGAPILSSGCFNKKCRLIRPFPRFMWSQSSFFKGWNFFFLHKEKNASDLPLLWVRRHVWAIPIWIPQHLFDVTWIVWQDYLV